MDSTQLDSRLSTIEARLSRIERSLALPQPAPAPVSRPHAAKAPAPAVATPEKPGNWLGVIAVLCFVLAAGFIIKLSVESGWLTPARQLGLAALLGFSLIWTGFSLLKSDREYASLLPGAGIIVLYLAAFAAHRYYGLVSFDASLVLVAMVSGLCIWLYRQLGHDIYAVTAAVGSYLAPFLLGQHQASAFTVYYFLLCSAAFASISVWVHSRLTTLISAYLAMLLTAKLGMEMQLDGVIAVLLAMHFVIFSAGTYLFTVRHRVSLTESEAWGFLPVLLLFYAMEYYFIERVAPGIAPWISLGFAGFLVALYLSARRFFPEGLASQTLILAFTTLVLFHSVYIELLPAKAHPWLLVAIMLALAFSPIRLSSRKEGNPFCIPVLALMAIAALEYINILFHLIDRPQHYWLMISLAAFASMWAALAAPGSHVARGSRTGHTLLTAAHLLAVVAFYQLTEAHGSLAVSASWLLYALAVIAFAFTRKDEVMAKSALFVLGFAAAKALLYDAASAPTEVRIVCLLLTGAVLYGCGFLMRKIGEWGRR